MIGDKMKWTSIIVGIIFFVMLVKGVFESGPWAILVLGFILISSLKKKKKKTRKKKSNSVSKVKKTTTTTSNTNNTIFTDMKIDPSDYRSDYTSEPINQTEAYFKDKKKLSKIRQMKSLASTSLSNASKEERISKLFYLQASFMSEYEEEYDINIPCDIQNPSLNNLNIYQLRSYYAWRTLVKKGKYNKTQNSYVLIYIYELINKIGVKNSIDGLNKLIELWQNYRKFDEKIDSYLSIWIKDYYVINNIKIDYKSIEDEFPIKIQSNEKFINELLIGNYENKLIFYDENSSYHILKSKIMEHKYAFLIDMVIPEVFKNLDKYFNSQNYSFNKILLGSIEKKKWIPFKNAIYYDDKLNINFENNFSSSTRYYKENDIYYKESYYISEYSKEIMGYILKNVDITLRECLKINRSLKININLLDSIKAIDINLYQIIIDKRLIDVINNTIKKYLIENKTKINNVITSKKKKEIVIDLEKFDDIRESSNRVQEKLIIEEEIIEEKNIQPIIEENVVQINSDDIFANLKDNLNDIEIQFIKKIINLEQKNNLIDYCKKNNILFEIMIENINNKSLETIGDNLIEDAGNEIIIYDEYISSIKEKIGGC